jgi:two-component system, OmpR family, phosphate regulon sensor histidine kinase PhoR
VLRGETDRILTIQLVPYGDNEKLLLSRDVTRWERLEAVRRDFIANVSHELRTPLTVMKGFLETLTDADRMDEKVYRRSLALMTDQAERMQRLVEDLLMLSRLEDSRSLLREESLDVPALLAAIVQEAQSISQGQHRITTDLAPVWLLASREEVRSAFTNLVTNAVRYTPPGGEIAVTWALEDGDPVMRVRDNGEGIAPEHIPRLTERFYRVDRGRSRASGGTGLGLAIVKHVLQRHQGRLVIESTVGTGSTFTCHFPAARRLPPRTESAEVSPIRAA